MINNDWVRMKVEQSPFLRTLELVSRSTTLKVKGQSEDYRASIHLPFL